MRNILIILGATILLSSCEKVIDVELKKEDPMLVVDAFIDNDTTVQTISLQYSQPYFDENPSSPAIGAIVKVISAEGDTFTFVDNGSNGLYKFTPTPTDTICKIGVTYRLWINYSGSVYEASSSVGVVPPIDSIKFTPNTDFQGNPNGYLAELFANDPANEFNFYRIKTYRNNNFYNDASDLNLSVNGGVNYPGYDGALFILPTRFSINRNGEPYDLGDSVKVEMLSINRDTWEYFSEVRNQINNQGLFAIPTTNVRTNIIRTSGSGVNAQGWFCTSALSRRVEKVK